MEMAETTFADIGDGVRFLVVGQGRASVILEFHRRVERREKREEYVFDKMKEIGLEKRKGVFVIKKYIL